MADTPHNDIEKQLQEYAKQRREAAGTPEMHPVTRRVLHEEVKQRFGTVKSETQVAGWAWFWPKLALACGVLAVLGIVAIFALPVDKRAKQNFTLAKLEEAKEARPVIAEPAAAALSSSDASIPAPVSISSGSLLAREEAAVAAKRGSERIVASKSAAKPAASLSSPAGSKKDSNGAVKQEMDAFVLNSAPKAKQSATLAGAVNSKTAVSKRRADSELALVSAKESLADKDTTKAIQSKLPVTTNSFFGNTGQRYRNIAVTDNQKKADQLPVLEEFTVAQDGEVLIIVDRDGSIYNGYARAIPPSRANFDNNYAEPANPVRLVPNSGAGGRAGAALDQRAMNRAYEQSQNARTINLENAGQVQTPLQSQSQTLQNMGVMEAVNYVFRVEGTNRSLNQRVVFTGNFLNTGNYSENSLHSFGNAANIANDRPFRSQQIISQFNQGYFNNRQQMPVFNNAINGRVQLEGKSGTELNALQVGQ